MDILEIIAGAVLIFSSLLIILLVTIQDNKGSGLSSAISGGDLGGMMSRAADKSRNEKLGNITKILAIVFFAITLAVDIFVLISAK